MKVILESTGHLDRVASLAERQPTPLIPIANRAIVHYVIEFLVEQGAEGIGFVLSHLPEQMREALGEGERWGSEFTYHLARGEAEAYRTIRAISGEWRDGPFLVGRADQLPFFQPDQLLRECAERDAVIPVASPKLTIANASDQEWEWSGWAAVSAGHLTADLGERLRELCAGAKPNPDEVHLAPVSISTRKYESILTSSRVLMNQAFPGLVMAGRESDVGVMIGRNLVAHPTARLTPPLSIGDNCRVGAGARLGPHTVVGDNCIIEPTSVLGECVVLSGSYIGEALEAHRAIIDHNLLVNLELGAEVTSADQYILGGVDGVSFGAIGGGLLSRLAGVVSLLLLSPLMLCVVIALRLTRRGRPIIHREERVRTPTDAGAVMWRTFEKLSFGANVMGAGPQSFVERVILALHLDSLPALVNVARGEMRLVGLQARSKRELENTAEDWRRILLSSKTGVLTLAWRLHGDCPSEDEQYASEIYYYATASWFTDLKILTGLGIHKGSK